MDHQFWLDRWQAKQIGFHRDGVHPFLTEHWPGLGLPAGAQVMVPLCGKAHDLKWLADAGHRVLGVELSEIAVADFFLEHGLRPKVDRSGPFRRYRAGRIEILAGDFFALGRERIGEIAAIFDRAALVALPPDQRREYASRLCGLTAPGTRMLLVTLQYPPAAIEPPPFSVSRPEIAALYGAWADIASLGERDDTVKGVACREAAYRLTVI